MLKRTIVYGGKFLDGTESKTLKDHTRANRPNYGLYDPDKKQAWIVTVDDFFECTVGKSAKEIQYDPVKFYDNEAEGIMKRNSIKSSKQIKSSHWVGSITGYGYAVNDEGRDIYNVEDFMNVIKDLSLNGYSFEYHNEPLSISDVKSYCFEDGEPTDDYNIDIVTSSRKINSGKQFRLIDTEHDDPKDGEDFTAEELKDYISKNDEYFDNVGLDYTIVDLNTGEEMNISTFRRLNSSRQIKSSKNIRNVTKDELRRLNGKPLNVNYNGREGKVWYDSDKKLCYDFTDGVEGTHYTSISSIIEDLKIELKSSRQIKSSRNPIKSGINDVLLGESQDKSYAIWLLTDRYHTPLSEVHKEYGLSENGYITRTIDITDPYAEETKGKWERLFDIKTIQSSRKSIKSAVDGGWRVDSSDVPEALDLYVEYFGEETALEEIAKAMGDYTLRENLEWIARQFGIAEDLEDSDTWDMYDEMLEVMGVSELFNNLTQAAGYDELAKDLAFIFRQYDFIEWDK